MELVKCWAIEKKYPGAVYLHFEGTKEDAIYHVKRLTPQQKKNVTAIFESFAGLGRWGYEEIHSNELPSFNSSWGIDGGDSISDEELHSILWD